MKRRAVDPAEESVSLSHVSRHTPYGRRQPQTSCDSCRKRKLKCDRQQPCSSCVARGLPCHGQPSAKRLAMDESPDRSSNESILRRLRALEEAVFENHKDRQTHQEHNSQSGSIPDTPPSSGMETYDHQPVRAVTAMPLRCLGSLKFGILTPPCNNPMAFAGCPPVEQGSVWMMPQEEAMALLQDYLDHMYPLLPIIHGPTSRDLIRKFYDGLSRGEPVAPQAAAVILGISAISAYFWQPDTGHHARFPSSKEASESSHVWRDWVADILTNTPKGPGSCTLEVVQAWTLLSFMVLNVEGCSYRFRFFHHCAIAAARELLIHVVDSPKADPNQDRVTRELKRRIWWYIAVTDWFLGFMGGPNEGTYSIQARHMMVKYPRNINDNDMATFDDSTNAPVNMSTQMSYFLQRIRVGEIVREVLDTNHPGGPDVDITDYDKVRQLDHLFEQAFMDLPPFFQNQHPLPPRKLDTLKLQCVMLQLGLHARRARLHRPFLLQQCPYEPRHQRSREICLKSTRAVVSLSISILQYSLTMDQAGADAAPAAEQIRPNSKQGFSTHRLGLVINHLSTACTVLALHAGANLGPSGSNNNNANNTANNGTTNDNPTTGTAPPTHGQNTTAGLSSSSSSTINGNGDPTDERAAISDELSQACRVLGAIGAESPVAADLLRNLVGLLKRYRVQGAGADGEEGHGGGQGGGQGQQQQQQQQQQQPQGQGQSGGQGQGFGMERQLGGLGGQQQQLGLGGDMGGGAEEMHWRATPGQMGEAPTARFVADANTAVAAAGDMMPAMVVADDAAGVMVGDAGPLSLDGLWDGFVMGSSDDYNQLFTDLDYYCGIA